jgi:hypothetical protein
MKKKPGTLFLSYTVWFINDRLSGNLQNLPKFAGNLPETCWKPAGNLGTTSLGQAVCTVWSVNFGLSQNLSKICRKPVGNLHGQFILLKTYRKPAAEVSGRFPAGFRRFPGNPSLRDLTVH